MIERIGTEELDWGEGEVRGVGDREVAWFKSETPVPLMDLDFFALADLVKGVPSEIMVRSPSSREGVNGRILDSDVKVELGRNVALRFLDDLMTERELLEVIVSI